MNNQASEIPRNWDSWGLQCKEGILQSTISTVTVMLSYSERKKARTKITRQFFRLGRSLYTSERTSLFLLSIWHVQSVNCRRITKPITLHLNQWIYGHLHIDIKPMFVLATCFPFATCHKRVFFFFSGHCSKIWRPWLETPEDDQRKQRQVRFTVSWWIGF